MNALLRSLVVATGLFAILLLLPAPAWTSDGSDVTSRYVAKNFEFDVTAAEGWTPGQPGANLTSFRVRPTGNCAGRPGVPGFFSFDGPDFCCPINPNGLADCGPARGGLRQDQKSSLDRINVFFDPTGDPNVFWDIYCQDPLGSVLQDFGQGTAEKTLCSPGDNTLCLNDGRFQVKVEWRDFDNVTGSGLVVPFDSEDSGAFYFFSPNNTELLLKVLDGCGINDHFWVFAAATTNVEYELTVVDTQNGLSKSYSNPLGRAAPAITDTAAFATCP